MGLGLATPVDSHHPTSARAIEARWFALPTPVKNKLRDLEARRDALHGACDSLRSRLLALRAELSEKAQRLKHALAEASPGGAPGPERQQAIDRLAEDLRRLETLATEARRRWEVAARCHQNARDWLEATEIVYVVPVVGKYERPA